MRLFSFARVVVVLTATALPLVLSGVSAEAARVCKDDHWHDGAGEILGNRKAALASAISYWTGYTAAEYGDAWANWNRSADRKVTCDKLAGDKWQCFVVGRPCTGK